ncbi:hypothetical protein O181_046597 [Austropuccinia psidii MF-1]|uniref:Uncharacterized protein n=1 Tax=Austropuccinia psidii MF-1 TaxID=1389203 RepID=A0A9Q3DW67_9BASI|nr:hypothetical protein [Austropuccinia psidii MF-1]
MGASAKCLDRHNEILSSSEEINGPRKDSRPSEGLEIHFLQRKSPKDKSFAEKPKHFFRGPEERVGSKQDKSQVEAPRASKRKNLHQQVLKKGKQKEKVREKYKWNKAYPQNYRIPMKEKTAMENVLNMARALMEFENKEEERINQSFPRT